MSASQSFASLAGLTLTGNGSALASNYTLVGGIDSVDITPATLTVMGTTAAGKVYDGNALASLSGATLSGVIGGDVVTLGSDTTGTFATANAGSGIAVTTAMTIGGADAGNYTIVQPTSLAANISPYVLNLTGTRVYDATTTAAASLFGTAGVLTGTNGETLTLSGSGTLSSKNVSATGTFASLTGFTLTGNGGALAGNYTLAGGGDWVDITPATLTVTGTTAAGKVYDGNALASLSGAILSGVFAGDAVTLGNDTTGTFATKNVGQDIDVATAMTISGADAGNYTVVQPRTLLASITPKPITITATGTNMVYNGSTADGRRDRDADGLLHEPALRAHVPGHRALPRGHERTRPARVALGHDRAPRRARGAVGARRRARPALGARPLARHVPAVLRRREPRRGPRARPSGCSPASTSWWPSSVWPRRSRSGATGCPHRATNRASSSTSGAGTTPTTRPSGARSRSRRASATTSSSRA